MSAVEVNGEKACLSNVKGKHYAIGNVCTHMGGWSSYGRKMRGHIARTINYVTQLLNRRSILGGLSLGMASSLPELTFWIRSLLCLVVVRNQLFSFWNRTAGSCHPWTSDHKLCIHNWFLLHYRRINYQILLHQYCCSSSPCVASATCVRSSSWL